MFYVSKRIEVAASHKLNLPYESKCNNLHGHNFIITVHLKSQELNNNGMIFDFAEIKQKITDTFDHKNLNDIMEKPTAENIAKAICDMFTNCYKVEVQESVGNIAIYERD
jgi:6-pyruvoyltetrahydropterin/6-carboxytetrahydropterin synthase